MIYTFTGVTGHPQAAQQQVAARILSASTTLSRTVPTTGMGVNLGVRAQGMLSLFNDASSPQTFAAGTIYTGSNGVKVVSEKGGVVPAGNPNLNPPVWNVVFVPAQAVLLGQAGNIAANDIDVWQSNGANSSFVVKNDSAFSGGRDTQTFGSVQRSDLYTAANLLQKMANQDIQSSFAAQIQPGERMSGGMQCSSSTSYNHQLGSQAASLTATITLRCSEEVYDAQAALALAHQLLAEQIVAHDPQTLATAITAQMGQVTLLNTAGMLSIRVSAASSEFSSSQLRALATLIAGKNTQEAQHVLRSQRGVRQANIKLYGGNGETLPASARQITIIVANSA